MKYSELIARALDVIQEPGESVLERFLQTMKQLPEPEDALDADLRLLIVDMTVAEYLGKCKCEMES